MVTGHLITAYRTQFLDALFCVGQIGTGGGRIDRSRCGGRHWRAAAVTADGHVLLEAVHRTGHTASSTSVATCGTEQIRCVHITQLITGLVTSAHHRVRSGRAGRGCLVLGRHVLVQGRRRRGRLIKRVISSVVTGRLWRAEPEMGQITGRVVHTGC